MPSADKILDNFPNLTIQLIIGKPTYESIQHVHLKLNANATSIKFHLGNGRIGILELTVTPVVFKTLYHVHFIPLRNPGPSAIIPPGQTAAQIIAIYQTHEAKVVLYK